MADGWDVRDGGKVLGSYAALREVQCTTATVTLVVGVIQHAWSMYRVSDGLGLRWSGNGDPNVHISGRMDQWSSNV